MGALLHRCRRLIRACLGFRCPVDPFVEEAERELDDLLAGRQRAAGPAERHDPELAACYRTLQVAYGADRAAVKRAYRALMRRYHPDLQGGDVVRQREATGRAQEVAAAYRTIIERTGG